MIPIILAAGKGKRMGEITNYIPKPLLPINGKPIIEQNLKNLSDLGFKKVIIIVKHLKHLIMSYCGDGSTFGIKIIYLTQKVANGTGAALQIALNYLNEDLLVMAGDTLFTHKNISISISEFNKNNCDGFLALKELTENEILKTSYVELKNDNLISNFIEKPKLSQINGNISSALLHIYRPIFSSYLKKITVSSRGEKELTEATINMIKDGKIIKGSIIERPLDLTDPKDILKYNFKYLNNIL